MEFDDFIRVQASVDGAAPVTVLEFRGNSNNRLAVDTDLDGIGDGVALDLAAARFTANIPGMMTSSVVLTVSLRTTAHNEQLALDDIQLLCGPLYDSPPAPPSPPTVARHACAPQAHTQHARRAQRTSPAHPRVAQDTCHASTQAGGRTKRRTNLRVPPRPSQLGRPASRDLRLACWLHDSQRGWACAILLRRSQRLLWDQQWPRRKHVLRLRWSGRCCRQ